MLILKLVLRAIKMALIAVIAIMTAFLISLVIYIVMISWR